MRGLLLGVIPRGIQVTRDYFLSLVSESSCSLITVESYIYLHSSDLRRCNSKAAVDTLDTDDGGHHSIIRVWKTNLIYSVV